MSIVEPPAAFLAALSSLRSAPPLPGLKRQEIPPPRNLAPYSASIRVQTEAVANGLPIATGTLVVLYDPEQAEIWGGPFRLVTHLRTQIDEDMGTDPLLGEYLWVNLIDRLHQEAASFIAPVGTVTKELSQSFGGLQLQGSALNVDLRCSWSNDSVDLGQHLSAWSKNVLESAGIPLDLRTTLEVHNA